jgi:hypothetical protein
MSSKPEASMKRVAISKANAQMVAVVSVAAFVTIFCLFAAKAILSQTQYQARVITAKTKAHKQLQENIDTYGQLASSYKKFDSASTNIIGGSKNGPGPNDGSNSKIVLDALPSSYDFPALTSSIEKILSDSGMKVTSITGTDDELNQQRNAASPTPQPVSMPFAFTVSGANYNAVGQLITRLQQSIRPIQIDSIDLSGGINNMTLTVNAHTYYQPAKTVSITKQVVK